MAGLSPDGVLVVDKPTGPTSHDIVAQARRLYGTRSVGHAGTLDPMASGVLVLMFGEATKLSNYITAQNKSYTAEICFGRSTDSLDALGTTLEERPLPSGWPPRCMTWRRLRTRAAQHWTLMVRDTTVCAVNLLTGWLALRRGKASSTFFFLTLCISGHVILSGFHSHVREGWRSDDRP